MRAKTTLTTLALTAAATAAMAGPANAVATKTSISSNASEGVAAQSPPKTRTSVRRTFRSNGDIVFSGTLKRSNKANVCPGRGGTARLYRSRLSDGKTTKVDTSTISTKGKWELNDNRPGRYLVIVTATGCARAYSPSNGTWLFDPPNPAVPKD